MISSMTEILLAGGPGEAGGEPFVVLSRPVSILAAHSPEDVPAALHALDAAVRGDGLIAAGF